jgi:porin
MLLSGRIARADEPAPAPEAATAAGHEGDFWQRDALTGNWGGARSALEDAGFLLGADSIDEVLGNLSGGTRTGGIYEGRLELIATIDLARAVGWDGATLHANAYQIRGQGLSGKDLGNNLMVASNIEATRSTRLFDFWLEQVFINGALTVRAGQVAADDEFLTSQYASTFINATFGWPAIMSADLPDNDAAYPLATPGIRVKYAASNTVGMAAGLYDGDPSGMAAGDPQRRDAAGTAFRLDDSAFLIAEASYAVNQEPDATGPAASYKLGAWFHSARFADQRFDSTGRSLADPAGTGIAAIHEGDAGAYLAIDQALVHPADPDGLGVAAFLRLAGVPDDRNLVSFYADAGLNLTGILPGRPADVLGLALAVAKIGGGAQHLDEDLRRFSGLDTPIRDAETTLELTYRWQVAPWWTLQPDLQYIHHPGGNVPPPGEPVRAVANATVIGMRSAILF